jgi:hypothetical protein
MSTEIWAFRAGVRGEGADLRGMEVEALDGGIGKVHDVIDLGSRAFLLVDTGPWIFGRTIKLPAGLVSAVDREQGTVLVDRPKEQVKSAPQQDVGGIEDDAYDEALARHYASPAADDEAGLATSSDPAGAGGSASAGVTAGGSPVSPGVTPLGAGGGAPDAGDDAGVKESRATESLGSSLGASAGLTDEAPAASGAIAESRPESSESAPDLSESAPDLSESAPDLSESAPDLSESAPDLSDSAPRLSDSAPRLSESVPDWSEPAPDSSEPAPASPEPAQGPDAGEPDAASTSPPESSPAPSSEPAPRDTRTRAETEPTPAPVSEPSSRARKASQDGPEEERTRAPRRTKPRSPQRAAERATPAPARKRRQTSSGQRTTRSEGQRTDGRAKSASNDVPLARYDSMTAAEVAARLRTLTQRELAKVERYERRGQSRQTILSRVASLREKEPWRGYDEATVKEIREKLGNAKADRLTAVRDYERRHRDRSGVMDAVRRKIADV